MQLMKTAHYSLHCVIRTAAMHIQDPAFQLLEFLNLFPAQVTSAFSSLLSLYINNEAKSDHGGFQSLALFHKNSQTYGYN